MDEHIVVNQGRTIKIYEDIIDYNNKFVYRYFFCLGFLDWREGLIFHFLRGFWYRFLVDAKYYEHEKKQQSTSNN